MSLAELAPQMPSVVLVRPQLAENVGGVARVLHNFGFCDLRLVNPRSDFRVDQKALACACSGKNLLTDAKIFTNVTDAIASLQYVYATTARMRSTQRKCTQSTKLELNNYRCGIMFGPENSGLSNEDMSFCDEVVYIEAKNNPLNLVHAVAILAYQYNNNHQAVSKIVNCNLAEKKELSFLYDNIIMLLEKSEFFTIPQKKQRFAKNLSMRLSRLGLTHQEVSIFIGVLSYLKKKFNI